MVLEARFVSSCLIFPSRAMPLRSRLLASKGTSVSVVVRELFGGTFSLQEANQRGDLLIALMAIKTPRVPRDLLCHQAFSRIQFAATHQHDSSGACAHAQ